MHVRNRSYCKRLLHQNNQIDSRDLHFLRIIHTNNSNESKTDVFYCRGTSKAIRRRKRVIACFQVTRGSVNDTDDMLRLTSERQPALQADLSARISLFVLCLACLFLPSLFLEQERLTAQMDILLVTFNRSSDSPSAPFQNGSFSCEGRVRDALRKTKREEKMGNLPKSK